MEEVDLISSLPDALLGAIVGCLPGMENVRTSILSQRWKSVWNYSSNLNFDQKQMLEKSIQLYLESSNPFTRVEMAICRKEGIQCRLDEFIAKELIAKEKFVEDEIAKTSMLITSIIDGHIGPLKSCSIRHLPESCATGEVEGWLMKLLGKRVTQISMELECPNDPSNRKQVHPLFKEHGQTLDFPFSVLSKFEVVRLKNYYLKTPTSSDAPKALKTLTLNCVEIKRGHFQRILSHCSSLENLTLNRISFTKPVKIESSSLKLLRISQMVGIKILVSGINIEEIGIDSIYCQMLAIHVPKLQVLRFHNSVQMTRQVDSSQPKYLTTRDLIEIFCGILVPQASSVDTIFKNLVTLNIDFDLRDFRNIRSLSFALKACHHLQNLQINNLIIDDDSSNEDGSLTDSSSLLWQRMEVCECVNHQLKSLCINGYSGKNLETEFVKYLITSARVIEKITLWFVDDCLWADAIATLCLLTFPKASSKLLIHLKPGKKYMKEVGGSFEKWLTTLKF